MSPDKKPTITILMASYNGGAFITKQLDSLLAQTYTDWQLWIRDDGSTDNTVEIIKDFVKRHSNIRLVDNTSGVKGARANFSALFELARADDGVGYIMFCDQDDVWHSDKIEKSLAAMQSVESNTSNKPALIYGDLALMDKDDRILPGELKLKHQLRLRNLMSYNYALGCTMLLNRPLIDAIETIPESAENHDYWIALVASVYQSEFLEEKLISYRQHGQNTSGNVAGNNSFLSRFNRHFIAPEKEIGMLRARFIMLSDFLKKYGQTMPHADQQLLNAYLGTYSKGRIKVSLFILKNRIFRKGFFQSMALLYHILFFFKSIKAKAGVQG